MVLWVLSLVRGQDMLSGVTILAILCWSTLTSKVQESHQPKDTGMRAGVSHLPTTLLLWLTKSWPQLHLPTNPYHS